MKIFYSKNHLTGKKKLNVKELIAFDYKIALMLRSSADSILIQLISVNFYNGHTVIKTCFKAPLLNYLMSFLLNYSICNLYLKIKELKS